ncbi:glucan endo-1,3-beta-glucosidase 2-like [Miscanthus floridulus]|uniref:glucan endo-1,3-beta-glucosidase 2-like n=1 Tax=Miscanthus floridulus TaxID=154761 RepID=UPI0034579178
MGVNYSRMATNLPNLTAVVQLLKRQGIAQVKLYDADPIVLRALANTGIKVVVALPNEQFSTAASRVSYALLWVRRNVVAYYPATNITAQLNAVFSMVSKLRNYNGVHVVVSETGWPSMGDANKASASAANAVVYNGNLARRVLSGNAGTPRRPDVLCPLSACV